ncbi:VOC family protein [Actinoplanes sp. NPDC051633]|uniref:VOC family protein n=1 Tax=Actinoplanes sp. NPDC051633 TaxID=3155670 RepID=UPI00342CF043
MANQTGRPVAPARKLVAAVLGTFAVFVMVFGLGLSSWPIVALGAALLALAIALGMVNVVRRGARAWVAGHGQVKAISEPPASGAYGRAELQLVVVAPGLTVTEVLVRDPRIPVGKWPQPGETLPITVDVDDMRRVRIDWSQVDDRSDDGDPPPPSFEPADEFLDDDLLGDPEPPPWANRDRSWGRGPAEPSSPAPDYPEYADEELRPSAVVVHDTPGGKVVEGQVVDEDDVPRVLPQRAPRPPAASPADSPAASPVASPGLDTPAPQPADEPSTASAAQPSAESSAASTAIVEDDDDEQEAAVEPDPPADPPRRRPSPRPRRPSEPTSDDFTAAQFAGATPAPATPPPGVVPEQRAGDAPDHDDIDLPLDDRRPAADPTDSGGHDDAADLPLIVDPEPAPELGPEARQAMDEGLIAPPADAEPPGRPWVAGSTAASPPTHDQDADPDQRRVFSGAHPAVTTPDDEADTSAASSPIISGLDTPPADESHKPVNGSAVGVGAAAIKPDSEKPSSEKPKSEKPKSEKSGIEPRSGRPWADLEGGGYQPDDRTDDLITAYPSARPGPAGAIHGVGITVLVTDLDRSTDFYRDTLGFHQIDNGPGSAVLASGDTRLVLRTVHSLASDIGRLIYLNLEVGDVDAVYDELKAKGVKFLHGPRPVNRGDKLELWAATFYDPDGHNIAVTQWRAIR